MAGDLFPPDIRRTVQIRIRTRFGTLLDGVSHRDLDRIIEYELNRLEEIKRRQGLDEALQDFKHVASGVLYELSQIRDPRTGVDLNLIVTTLCKNIEAAVRSLGGQWQGGFSA